MKNNVLKINGKYLIFKTSIAGVKTHLLVDNGSEAELIDESFVHANKIPFFKPKKPLTLHSKIAKLSKNSQSGPR